MAVLLTPGQGRYSEPPPVSEHNEYPKHMVHPGYQPGVVGEEITSPHGFKYHMPGTAIRFAPVLAMNEDQEAMHAAEGYVSIGKSDPAAFARAVAEAVPVPADYQPLMYPKWAGGVLVNNAEEEAEALEQRRVQAGGAPAEVVKSLEMVPEPDDAVLLADAALAKARAEDAAKDEGKTPEQLRIEYLEAELAALKAERRVENVAAETIAEPPPAPPLPTVTKMIDGVPVSFVDAGGFVPIVEPSAASTETVLTHGEKIRLGRERAAALRAQQATE